MWGYEIAPSAHDVKYDGGWGDVWAWWAEHGFDGLAGALLAAGAVYFTLRHERKQSDAASAAQELLHNEALEQQRKLHDETRGIEEARRVKELMAEFLRTAAMLHFEAPADPQDDEWSSWQAQMYTALVHVSTQISAREPEFSDLFQRVSSQMGSKMRRENGDINLEMADAIGDASVALATAFLMEVPASIAMRGHEERFPRRSRLTDPSAESEDLADLHP